MQAINRDVGLSIAHLVAIFVVIALYLAGMTMSLFGPSQGRLLGIPAFLGMWILVGLLGHEQKDSTFHSVGSSRLRSLLSSLTVFCFFVCVASAILGFVAGFAGGAEHTHPIFDYQDQYRLNNHGTYTAVSRMRYRIVGSSFVITWHVGGIFALLIVLYRKLFAQWPMDGWRGLTKASPQRFASHIRSLEHDDGARLP